MKTRFSTLVFFSLLLSISVQTQAEQINVAVASNFAAAITDVSQRFENETGHQLTLIFGSTGKLYTQIKNGAPFDVFLAADERRPALLESNGDAIAGSRFTYAIGKIVLWSPDIQYSNPGISTLQQQDFRFLAIANPKLAPYGRAAEETLQALQLSDLFNGKIVRGENINQALQFVSSGNAQLGFVAFSQIKMTASSNSYWEVPQELYSPIQQQALLIKDNDTARDFLNYLQRPDIINIINNYGYSTP